MAYAILFKPSARTALLKLPKPIQARLIEAADALASDPRPHGVVKLTGPEGLWRIRVGDYRIVYTIEDRQLVVLVARVAHRREVYRD